MSQKEQQSPKYSIGFKIIFLREIKRSIVFLSLEVWTLCMLHILKETFTCWERKATAYCWWKEVDPVHTQHSQMLWFIKNMDVLTYKVSLKYPCDMTKIFPSLLQCASIGYLNKSSTHFVEITLSIVLAWQLDFRSTEGQNVQETFKIERLFRFPFFAALRLEDEISPLLIASIFLSKVRLRNTPVISHLMQLWLSSSLWKFRCFPKTRQIVGL